MFIENLPFCCTSAVLGSFGEHGEPSVVSVEAIKQLVKTKMRVPLDSEGRALDAAKRCVIATTVDPNNLRILKAAGFTVVDYYKGIQGTVHVMTLHLDEFDGQ